MMWFARPPFLFDVTKWDDWQAWLGDHGWSLLIILTLLVVANQAFRFILRRIFQAAMASRAVRRSDDPEGLKRRAETLVTTFSWIFGFFLIFVGVGLLLDEMGISITALVAGVGVVGIALGLGAQTLVKDVINGMFILIEDQYRVGDVVSVGGVSGVVVEINPRRTVLRNMDGHVHSVPNGSITIATNMTQGFSRINLDIPIAYRADVERVIAVINEVCEKMAAEMPEKFLVPPSVLRIDAFQDLRLTIKVTADVVAGQQWTLTGELRRRIKVRLDEEGIPMTPEIAPVALAEDPGA